MNYSDAIRIFDAQVENSIRILQLGFGINDVEVIFFDIIRLLRQENCLKEYLLKKIENTLNMPDPGCLEIGMVPKELIELIAHEFRWDELQLMANKRIKCSFYGDISFAAGDIACGIIEANNDNWQYREFYNHYRKKMDNGLI